MASGKRSSIRSGVPNLFQWLKPSKPAPIKAEPPPAPVIKYIDRPPPPPIIQYIERPAPPPPAAPNPALTARLSEPSIVIDLGTAASTTGTADDAAVHAVVLHKKSMFVPQGALIPAVIETPIDTSVPGPIRAVTTGDTKGFDGTRILIPKGSRLIGELKGDVQPGQDRLAITWTRLVRPDGVAIKLSSVTSDRMGQAGLKGQVDNHILQRVSGAVLESALTVGVALASRPGNGSVVLGVPAQGATAIQQSFAPTGENRPTVKVPAGAAITVFVTHDLDFTGTASRR
jgi:type IV secretion system protein VirB10